MKTRTETAVFGGGCFWCTEAIFSELKGVLKVMPGYTGGRSDNPTYQQVCGGNTGHVEAVRIEYDPALIGYNDLLEVFFYTHDPTTPNHQGNDFMTRWGDKVEALQPAALRKKVADAARRMMRMYETTMSADRKLL